MRKTLAELNREVYRLLSRHLSAADFVRFVRQLEPGQGDWTKERRQWMKQFGPGEFTAYVKRFQAERLPEPGKAKRSTKARSHRRPKTKA